MASYADYLQQYNPNSFNSNGGYSPVPSTNNGSGVKMANPTMQTTPLMPGENPLAKPSWMGPGAYMKWKQGSDRDYDPADPVVNEEWWRDPSNPGGIVYNNKYGWQDRSAVKNLYKQGTAFDQFGLTPQLEQDYAKYYPNGIGNEVGPGGGGGAGVNPNLSTPYAEAPQVIDPQASGEDMLARFGYTGPMDINPYEQAALDFSGAAAQGGGPLNTMAPAQSFYGDVLSGMYDPQGQAFRQAVYDPTKTEALGLLQGAQKNMADKFSGRGGYFSGNHALAQSDLAGKTNTSLAQLLGNLNLEGYNQGMSNKMGAAGQLPGMATSQQGIVSDILNNLHKSGSLVTGREAQNRAEYQSAEGRAYDDWLRARNEQLNMFNTGLGLLGQNPIENLVQQPQPSAWGQFLGGLGGGLGTGLGALIGG